jgi:hypothetical protein
MAKKGKQEVAEEVKVNKSGIGGRMRIRGPNKGTSSVRSVYIYKTVWHHLPEDRNLYSNLSENLKSHIGLDKKWPLRKPSVSGGGIILKLVRFAGCELDTIGSGLGISCEHRN